MKKQRQHERYHLRWRIALVFDAAGENFAFQGRTRDLSLYGAAMHTEHHMLGGGSAIVLLAPPPLSLADCQKIIEVKARVINSVHSCDSLCFRIGLQFLEFRGDSRDLLRERLSHHQPAFDTLILPPSSPLPPAPPASLSR